MNMSGIGVGPGGAPQGNGKADFAALLADGGAGSASSGPSGPAGAGSGASIPAPRNPTMPADEEFLVVEDVSTTTETGEEVAVVSGEAVEGTQAALSAAAEKGGAVILPLSGPRLQARSISGSVFASMLLDQRSGALPNPFSLWRIPDQTASGDAQAADGAGATASPPVAPVSAPAPTQRELPVASGEEDGLAMGREMSRLEAAISQLVLKLEQMLKSLRSLIGNLTRLYGGSPR